MQTAHSAPGVYDGYSNAYPAIDYESDIRIIDIHPTVAYKISDKLSVGLGASVVIGQIEIRQPAFLQNPYLYESTIYDVLAGKSDDAAMAILDEMRKPPFDHLITEAHMKSSGNTFGANLGFMYKATQNLNIGASVQYYADLKSSGDYQQMTYFGDNPAYQAQADFYTEELFQKLYDVGGLDDEQFQIVSEFYSGNVLPRVQAEATATIPMPLKAGLGLSYTGFENLLLAFDLSWTQWSVWDVIEIAENDGPVISALVQNWQDTYKVSVGAEYALRSVKLRGGFGYDTRAAVNESVSPTIPDIGDRMNISLGVAVPIGPVEIAINFEHIMLPDLEFSEWIYDELTVNQNVPGTYSMNASNIMVGIDYTF
jgi:long-chain fatty acid transport protein